MARKKKSVNSPSKGDPLGGYAELSVEHLRERLALLKGIILKRAIRKDLAAVRFDIRMGAPSYIMGTDLELRLQLRLDTMRVTGAGRLMIDAHALNLLLDTYAEPRVRLHLDDVRNVRLEGLQSKLTLPGFDPEKEWKTEVEGCLVPDGWMIRGDDLASAIQRTRYAIDEESTRYLLGGLATLFPEHEGVPMQLVGCDGRRLSRVRLPVVKHGNPPAFHRPNSAALKTEGWPQIRGKAVATVLKLARSAGQGMVGIAVIPGDRIDLVEEKYKPGAIQVVTRDAVLTIGQLEGRYPYFYDVFPTSRPTVRVKVDNAEKLRFLLANAVGVTDSEHKAVEITAAGGTLMLEVESETKGKGQFFLTGCEMEGRGTKELDALMFRQFFDSIGDSPVEMEWFGPKDAVLLHAGPDHDFIIMPIGGDDGRQSPPPPATEPVASEPEPEGDEPEGDEPDGDGTVPESSEPEPEPVGPVAEAPEAHEGNGKVKPKPKPGRNGRAH